MTVGGLALSVVLSAAVSVGAVGAGEIVLACNEFPPFKMEKSDSGLPGFDVEFLTAAFAGSGTTLKIVYQPWMRALQSARTGKVDGLCSCSHTREREDFLVFSDPLGQASSGLFSVDDMGQPEITSLQDIGSKIVGVIRGYNLVGKLEAAKAREIVRVSSEIQGLQMLLHGRLDYYYSYEAPSRFYLKRLETVRTVKYHEISNTPYYSCLSRNSPGVEDRIRTLNAGLRRIRADGTNDAILAKYR